MKVGADLLSSKLKYAFIFNRLCFQTETTADTATYINPFRGVRKKKKEESSEPWSHEEAELHFT